MSSIFVTIWTGLNFKSVRNESHDSRYYGTAIANSILLFEITCDLRTGESYARTIKRIIGGCGSVEIWRRMYLDHPDFHYCLLVAGSCEMLKMWWLVRATTRFSQPTQLPTNNQFFRRLPDWKILPN
jgi:hypothetical protein